MPRAMNMKPVRPDAVLAAIVGDELLQRTAITKRVWHYIKERGLQDATNRRQINADEQLRALFDGRDSVTMFELPKCVTRHVSLVEG